MTALIEQGITLRPWQERALQQILVRVQTDFLVVACPGSGKTNLALAFARHCRRTGICRRIIVVCPTNHLRSQWALAAHRWGLSLDPNFSNEQRREAADYSGVVVTYQQVCQAPAIFAEACLVDPTLVILDEIHHAGDGREWGEALRAAFGRAARRLELSGTPFRTDAATIPFIRYENERSVADFTYGYTEALADGVCRIVHFPSYDGDLKWLSNGRERSHTFADEVPESIRRERVKAAILHKDWLGAVLNDAHQDLMEMRQTDPDAAGLVIASNQAHAREVARRLQAIMQLSSWHQVALAVSDEPRASATIKAFGQGQEPWIVAVNMVSEGVDIPRARIVVYATSVQTEMYFRQVTGRVTRVQPDHALEDQVAKVYIPRDPILVEYAHAIEEERDHVLAGKAQPKAENSNGSGDSRESSFLPLEGVARADEVIGVRPLPGPPVHEQKEELRETHQRLVCQLAHKAGIGHRKINLELQQQTGCWIERATVSQLKKRIDMLNRWIRHGYDGR